MKKNGKYIECMLEGCNQKKYYPLSKVKRNNAFYCCLEHKYAGIAAARSSKKKGKYIKCTLEGCDNETYYYPHKLKRNKTFYCCLEHKYAGAQKTEHICTHCGESFHKTPALLKNRKRPFCSFECYKLDKGYKPDVHAECTQCGESFTRPYVEAKRSKRLFCSRYCWELYTKENGNAFTVFCDNCGIPFKRTPSRVVGEHTFCSNECQGEHFTLYPKTLHLRKVIQTRRAVENLKDQYVIRVLFPELRKDELPDDIPKDLIRAKRVQLLTYRQSQNG